MMNSQGGCLIRLFFYKKGLNSTGCSSLYCDLWYVYANNPQQISNIADNSQNQNL